MPARSRAGRIRGPRRATRAPQAYSCRLARQQPGDRVDRPLRRVVDHPLGGARVAVLARLVEVPVVRDGSPEALAAREHDPVVALCAPEEALDFGDEARPACRLVARGVELPADAQVAVDVLFLPKPFELGEQRAHASELRRADSRGADAGSEPLEAEARGVDLLEVLTREPAHHRAACIADLDEAGAREFSQAHANRRLRDAEPLCEVALDERRSLGQL